MTRFKSFVIHATKSSWSCALADIEESFDPQWRGKEFRTGPSAISFYEYLRSPDTAQIVGMELHLFHADYDNILSEMTSFVRNESSPLPSCWQFKLVDQTGEIYWEQIMTENPFVSADGEVLLILQTGHLTDSEYLQLETFAAAHT